MAEMIASRTTVTAITMVTTIIVVPELIPVALAVVVVVMWEGEGEGEISEFEQFPAVILSPWVW